MTADGMPQRATVTYLGSEKLPTPPGIPNKPMSTRGNPLIARIREALAIMTAPIYTNDDNERATQVSDNLWNAADILRDALREQGEEPPRITP